MKLILGSASRTRQKILKKLGYKFEVVTADIDEKKIRAKTPRDLVLRLALKKAAAIKIKLESGVLITSDQVTLANNKILEKAKNLKEAEKFLKSYSKNSIKNITAVVATNIETDRQAKGVDITAIQFEEIPDPIVQRGLKDKYVLNYCGAICIGDKLWQPYIKRVIGDRTALFGISIRLMDKLIKRVK